MVKHPPANAGETGSLVQEDTPEKEMYPAPVLLSGKFHRQSSLAGYSPVGCKESDMILNSLIIKKK